MASTITGAPPTSQDNLLTAEDLPRPLVPEQHAPAAKRAPPRQPKAEPDIRGAEQRSASPEQHRLHVDPVLVNQVVPHERGREVSPAQHQASPVLCLQSPDRPW